MRAVVDKRGDFLPLLLVSSLFLSPVENETIEFTWNKRRKCYEKYAIARFKCTLKSYSLVLNNISVYLFNEMIFFPFFLYIRSCTKFMWEYLSICSRFFLYFFFNEQTSWDPLYLLFAPFASSSMLENWCRLSYVVQFWFIVSKIISVLHRVGIYTFIQLSHSSFWLIYKQ